MRSIFGALPTVAALALVALAALTGCAGQRLSPGPGTADHRWPGTGDSPACIADFDPAADYFPVKSQVLDAANFTLDYHRSYQVLTVKQPYPGGRPVPYVLVRCGAPAPALTGELARAQQISVPIGSLYSASTTHLEMIGELDATEVVTGVADPGHVGNAAVRAGIAAGRVVGYAPGRALNVEAVLAASPDVLVTAGNDDPGYAKLRSGGVAVVADAEWLEPSPLGRAEWVKVFAALTGTEARAARVYQQISHSYRTLAQRAASTPTASVLTGTSQQGGWAMPTGGDYAGRLILDAGGWHPWVNRHDRPGLVLNFESVYAQAGAAPRWLVTNAWRSVDDALAQDSRYGELAAIRHGEVWSATGVTGPGGRSGYWERGTARPDLVLGDLVAILHPELAPGHRFEFYRQVAPR